MKTRIILTVSATLLAGCQSSKKCNQAHHESTYYPQTAPAPIAQEVPAPIQTAGLEVAEQADINLHKEELVVGKREVSNGGVMVRTIVKSEEIKQPVELRREEYVLERIPPGSAQDQQARADGAFNGREIYIPLMKEEPITGKRTLLTESITLGKRVETENQTVTLPVRTEDVRIVKNPDLNDPKFASVPRRSNGSATLHSAAGAPSAAETGGGSSLNTVKEELMVAKLEKDAGGVYLQKIIHTENASQPVQLRREEFTVDRKPLSGEIASADFAPRQIQLSLSREEPVAGTRNFVTETVRVRKQTQTDKQIVSGTVRQESAEIVRVPESSTTAQGTPPAAQTGTSSSQPPAAQTASSQGQTMTRDDILQDHVRESLAKPDGSAKGYRHIVVTANNGEVTLNGDVSSDSEKKAITKRVEKMSGVRSVDNELRVIKASNR
jgi:uncharacterized protein (TIGR02271 family)